MRSDLAVQKELRKLTWVETLLKTRGSSGEPLRSFKRDRPISCEVPHAAYGPDDKSSDDFGRRSFFDQCRTASVATGYSQSSQAALAVL